jgi:hypothetical protein
MTCVRHSEVYSGDRKRRIAVLLRPDGLFQLFEETVRSYENGDEWNPTLVPFPDDGVLDECSMIFGAQCGGLFGSGGDAEAEARRLLSAN